MLILNTLKYFSILLLLPSWIIVFITFCLYLESILLIPFQQDLVSWIHQCEGKFVRIWSFMKMNVSFGVKFVKIWSWNSSLSFQGLHIDILEKVFSVKIIIYLHDSCLLWISIFQFLPNLAWSIVSFICLKAFSHSRISCSSKLVFWGEKSILPAFW